MPDLPLTGGNRGSGLGQAIENWAGNYTYRARAIHAPATLEELQEIVTRARRIRVLGSRHSFTDIADSDELVSLERLPAQIEIDPDALTVRSGGALRYGELPLALEREGLALANLASLPHISVAGAVATATHGSGVANGNLATAVAALELVLSDGSVKTTARGDPDFDGAVVGLGAIGVVTSLVLDAVPFFEIQQHVFEGLPWGALFEHLDEIVSLGYSVSAFTRWGDQVDQVWVKTRPGEDRTGAELFGARAARHDRHPIEGLDPINATPQLGVPGPWFDRLPHFRMGFTPSSGAELQSEYIVARQHGVDAIRAVQSLSAVVGPLTQVSEIRAVAADSLWLSPQYRQDTITIHFTWRPEPEPVVRALAEVERALEPFAARPHWGKLFLADTETIAGLYQRLPDFRSLCERLDPRHAFRNEWLERHVLTE
jgi:xylitol oxidase